MIFKNKKGQGALEYLLIISGALIVAVTVVVIIVSMSSSNRDTVSEQDKKLSSVIDNTIVPPIVNIIDCNNSQIRFSINSSDSDFIYVLNNGDITELNTNPVNGVYTLTGVAPSADGKYSLTIASVVNEKYSAFSKPVSTCKP